MYKLFSLGLFSFVFAAASAQQTAPSTVVRDPQALTILTQSLNTAGGVSVVSAIQDFIGSGTVTYNWAGQQVQGTVSVKGLGAVDFRMDAVLPQGTQSWVVNHLSGTLQTIDGRNLSLSPLNLINAGSLTLPEMRIVAALDDPSTSITFSGQTLADRHNAYVIQVITSTDPTLTSIPGLSGVGNLTLYIDTSSNLVFKLVQSLFDETNLNQTYADAVNFSDYQQVNGIAVPFAVAETFGGQQTWSLALSSISFNNGLSDSDFTLP